MSRDDEDRIDLVTVVVPCYNDGKYLLENLESLKAQTYKNFEVVVVNDGSTDPITLKVLENLHQRFPSLDLRVYSQNNQGLPATRNRGIREARGEWIVTLDADDMIAPDYLEKTMALAQAKDLDFVVTDIQNFGVQDFVNRANINLYDELFTNRLPACAFFKKSVVLCELYDIDFRAGFEDWELWIRLQSKGYRGDVVHEPLYLYRRKDESMLTRTHFQRPQLIRKIRLKHADLYTPKQLAQIKQEHRDSRCVAAWLYDFHYHLGLHFPYLAYWMGRIYLHLRPLKSIWQ
jgi:glycosyltransferase involved in cell wall biosynthesis